MADEPHATIIFQSQKFLFAAARDRLARKGIKNKRDRTPPTVQHPGAGSAEIASREDYGFRALSEKINRTTAGSKFELRLSWWQQEERGDDQRL